MVMCLFAPLGGWWHPWRHTLGLFSYNSGTWHSPFPRTDTHDRCMNEREKCTKSSCYSKELKDSCENTFLYYVDAFLEFYFLSLTPISKMLVNTITIHVSFGIPVPSLPPYISHVHLWISPVPSYIYPPLGDVVLSLSPGCQPYLPSFLYCSLVSITC